MPRENTGFSEPKNPVVTGGSVSEAGALSPTDRHRLIVEWNQTRRDYPGHLCTHQLFEAQVERDPEAAAVEYRGERLSYRELNRKANQLAHHLRDMGVGPEVLVGICLQPSPEMVVGLLGILKAGGAYVPLDPDYPGDRLAFMVQDSDLQVVLTSENLMRVLPASVPRTVWMETDRSHLPFTNPFSGIAPENLAYVIYTSGSTGKPKGVMIPHRGLVNYLTWAIGAYSVAEGRGAPVHSSISFDLTITALFTPLLAGKSVVMIGADTALTELGRTLRENPDFSLVKITPAHLELLRSQLPPGETRHRTGMFVVGGEALLGSSIRFWQDHAPETVLVNEYGPTETVVGCCVYFVPQGKRFEGPIPIGRPIANTQVYVLDADLEPVAIGKEGELYVGGAGVARGYLKRPELTAVSFIPNPFRETVKDSPRLYRTGDLVRYLPDGNLEFLGRIDQQVKVRGYRIETGEIESVLALHPGVRSSAVLLRGTESGDKFLAAYIVMDGLLSPTAYELRDFLKKKLPAYMIPASFVLLDEFPLTPNGKVDRQALPSVGLEASEHVTPETELEQKLVALWERLFELPCVGLRDNFFERGGHSLLAAKLITEINHTFEVKLDILRLYDCPTIEGLAAAIRDARSVSGETSLAALKPEGAGSPVFFVRGAPLEAFYQTCLRLQPQPFFVTKDPPSWTEALRGSARPDYTRFPTVEEMAAPHVAMIRETQITEPCVLAGWSYGGLLAFEVAHQLSSQGTPVEAVILLDADMKPPEWVRIRRHMRNLRREGFRYVSGKIRERLQGLGNGAAHPASAAVASQRDLLDPMVDWELSHRIWLLALKHYRRRRLDARGVLLRARESIYTVENDFDGVLGWKGLFRGGLQVLEIPAGHLNMWIEPFVVSTGKAWVSALASINHDGHPD